MSTIADPFTSGPVLSSTGPGVVAAADSLMAAVSAVDKLGSCSADYDALSDAELLAGQRDLARLRGLVETRSVWLAKTLAHRSRRELGQEGLAARQGFLSPDELIQEMTGSTRQDARKLVDVGRMLGDAEAAQEAQAARAAQAEDESAIAPGLFDEFTPLEEPVALPWHAPISDAVSTGALSVAAAHAIRTGLGDIDSVVTGQTLADAVRTLLEESRRMNVDALLKRSRRMRDSLDEAGIAIREQKAWDDRYLRVWKTPAGQVHIHGLFPPEQGEFIVSVYDSLTGPRRGGVRFVDPDRAAWAKAVQDDPRSTEQIAADTFIDLLKAGAEVNPNRMLGGRTPAVRVLTTEPDQRPVRRPAPAPVAASAPEPDDILVAIPDGTGHGYIEGNPAPVSKESIDRLICTSGTVEVVFDTDGQPLNLGREERIFSQAQRLALAARDGGCRWGTCDRPPSQTEAHHLEHWARDHGHTDIRLGILLCPPHHRLLHAQGWQIFEHHGRYWSRPPASVDPGQVLIELRSNSPTAPR
ncbi:DUF222 domain-containing protein [Cryobacterium sp. SO2]|uniref:HNH endonuclease signature motif containing protein n=1 Tax=Cryobacterium sp. SO2 TaxID=1897060 RepID=UPI0023DCA4B8|nr:HNH endonuclease signature motif containing protein [Cryobacterium sp. SO2]WEO76967.1 DUF222 domain-containing protein [Cryobacterium sp. SO2]